MELIEPAVELLTALPESLPNDLDLMGSLLDLLSSRGRKEVVVLNKLTNNMVWLKSMEANKKLQLDYSYRISYPGNANVDIQ